MNLSDYLEGQLIDHLFRTNTWSKPSTLYFSLHTGDPGEDGATANEVSGNGYARVAVTPGDANFTAQADASPGRKTQNNVAITFPSPTGAWGTITYVGVWSAASAGNLLCHIALTASKVIGATDPAPEFPVNAFTFTANTGSTYLNDKILQHLFRTGSFAKPTTLGFALMTTAPTDAGGGTEVTGGSYARVSVTPLDANFAAPTSGNGVTSNSGNITWPAPTANWGACLAVAIYDAGSGGNLITWDGFSTVNINNGDQAPKIVAGQCQLTVA